MKVKVRNLKGYIQEVYLINETPRLAFAVVNLSEDDPEFVYFERKIIFANGAEIEFSEVGETPDARVIIEVSRDRNHLGVTLMDSQLIDELFEQANSGAVLYEVPDEEDDLE